jgi:hypothetical protein
MLSSGKPILPCGKLRIKSGENKYFNVAQNGESTTEVYQIQDWRGDSGIPNFKFVTTSGKSSISKIGEISHFYHDQNGRPLFSGRLIDTAREFELATKLAQYGNQSHYVYK